MKEAVVVANRLVMLVDELVAGKRVGGALAICVFHAGGCVG